MKKLYPLKYSDIVYKYSREYDIDPYLVFSVIKAESNFNPDAVSHKSAYGLMQVTSTTGEWIAEQMKIEDFTLNKLFDPEYNIPMGCWYIDNLRKEFGDNMDVVLAAYNAGRGNVQKWLNDTEHSKDGKNLHYIPFKETDKYVKKVKVNYKIYKFLYDK
ncbi:lytic transglycosylase domain-containing protein [Clostridium sp. MSJ-11]|uniref:Lytic transglycosylase domain-containing protein n=1 Tax=Clostridium mobile TaxID=2841512 RepID=A0ABS6EK20_9CLOT|nr:lytic transglycosylase domain-containing protein [Clostridium mobile]MBU5485558.1 lytic transglycosylase domain-containing protein [Clostridium mobile]